MKIAVVNSKGGVGKSTISIQIASIYLYTKFNTVIEHFEFDDENEDSKAFVNSKVINRHTQSVAKTNLRDTITDILLDYEHLVFDIGANKTTTYFIDALIDTGMMSQIDLFIIPLMDGENDAISAIKIYNQLKEEDSNTKILFALNRVNTNRDINSQFNLFLGDKRGVFNDSGLIDTIAKEDRKYITIEDSDSVKYSKNFGTTIWELAKLQRDISQEIKDALANNESKETIRMLSFKKGVKDDCQDYLNINVDPSFEIIDTMMQG
jgi:cellulose biosynthesis protein BcsQ